MQTLEYKAAECDNVYRIYAAEQETVVEDAIVSSDLHYFFMFALPLLNSLWRLISTSGHLWTH